MKFFEVFHHPVTGIELSKEDYYRMILQELKEQWDIPPDLEAYYLMRIRGIKDQGIHPDLAALEDRVD